MLFVLHQTSPLFPRNVKRSLANVYCSVTSVAKSKKYTGDPNSRFLDAG